MLSAMLHKKPYLTQVSVSDASPNIGSWISYGLGAPGQALGGIEDETDADGGTNIKNLTCLSYPNLSAPQTLRAQGLRIPWNARYNYRLGFGALYEVVNLILFKDGAVGENQTYAVDQSNGLGYAWKHFGFNLDPSNRNLTTSARFASAAIAYYPKGIA